MNGVEWTADRIERLKAYAAQRMTARQIAAEFGDVTRFAIIGAAGRNGVQLNPKPAWLDWTQEMTDQLITLRESGSSITQISFALGIHNMSVKRKLRKLGLSQPRTVKPKLKSVPRPKPAPPPSELPFLGVTLLDKTETQCCFPHGGDNGEPILFCGQPKAEHSRSYCGFHHSICHTKPATKEQCEEAAREYHAKAA